MLGHHVHNSTASTFLFIYIRTAIIQDLLLYKDALFLINNTYKQLRTSKEEGKLPLLGRRKDNWDRWKRSSGKGGFRHQVEFSAVPQFVNCCTFSNHLTVFIFLAQFNRVPTFIWILWNYYFIITTDFRAHGSEKRQTNHCIKNILIKKLVKYSVVIKTTGGKLIADKLYWKQIEIAGNETTGIIWHDCHLLLSTCKWNGIFPCAADKIPCSVAITGAEQEAYYILTGIWPFVQSTTKPVVSSFFLNTQDIILRLFCSLCTLNHLRTAYYIFTVLFCSVLLFRVSLVTKN